MERLNGYIDLNKEFVRIKKNNLKSIVATERCSTDAYWIKNFNGKNYLFKVVVEEEQKYRSLLVEEMAKMVGIKVPVTDLAVLGYLRGELIEDYRKENCEYIPGAHILYEYYLYYRNTEAITDLIPAYLNPEDEDDLNEILQRMNNLETIWNALSFHYRKLNEEDKRQIIERVMRQLANRFAFDFMTMQYDRHSANWELEESADGRVDLTPHFDNNRSFYALTFQLEMGAAEKYNPSKTYEQLSYYLEYSSNDFQEFFYKMFLTFTPEVIDDLLNKVEKKIECKIPKHSRDEILDSYQEHYRMIQNIAKKKRRL